MEAEAPREDGTVGRQHRDRDRLALDALDRATVEREADTPPRAVGRRVRTGR
jgi:hypothetical protein